jgi:esterase/lipase
MDDKGSPQYSDHPPEGVDAVFIEKNTTSSPTSSYQKNADQAVDENGDPVKMEVLAAKDPVICEQAKANLSALQSARVRITNADGSQHYLTEDEKAEQRDRAQRLIELNC